MMRFCLLCIIIFRQGITLAQNPSPEPINPVPQGPSPSAQTTAKADTPNPHWQPDRCDSCHQILDETPVKIPPAEVNDLCLRCHDGRQGPAEIHPVGRRAQREDVHIPADWPTLDDQLTCLTCHDVLQACQNRRLPFSSDSTFLRARWSRKRNEFCRNCHQEESYQQLPVHIMLQGSNDIVQLSRRPEIIAERCLFCHRQIPDRDRTIPTGEAQLRNEITELCLNCHSVHSDYFDPGHLGAYLTDEMAAFMYAREILGRNVKPGTKLLHRLEAAHVQPTLLRPNAQGRITCTTCHNPHQQGVFPEESDLAFEAMWLTGPNRIKSPSTSREICDGCHEK